MKLYWKVLTSLLVAMLLYWGMVTAFQLLNLASDLAVLGGVCLLLFIIERIWLGAPPDPLPSHEGLPAHGEAAPFE